MKTLKREEIYANTYVDLEHLRTNIEAFIEQYYNRCRLHSALGYQAPDEFEQQLESTVASAGDDEFFQAGGGLSKLSGPLTNEERLGSRSSDS